MTIAFLLCIGYLELSFVSEQVIGSAPGYRIEYMFGYSLPITVMGLIVYAAFAFVYRTPKKIYRKITISDQAEVNRQIPAFENS